MKAKVCPACNWIAGSGYELCRHCRGALVEGEFHYEEFAEVRSCSSLPEAEVVRTVLADNAIPAVIPEEGTYMYFSALPLGREGFQVLVPQSFLAEARRVLEEARSAGLEGESEA